MNQKISLSQNAILCAVFGLAFLSGGVPTAVYATNNSDFHRSICSAFATSAYCEDLETVYISQFVAAVSYGQYEYHLATVINFDLPLTGSAKTLYVFYFIYTYVALHMSCIATELSFQLKCKSYNPLNFLANQFLLD